MSRNRLDACTKHGMRLYQSFNLAAMLNEEYTLVPDVYIYICSIDVYKWIWPKNVGLVINSACGGTS